MGENNMNKKELTILATQEAKMYQNTKKYKQTARYFYNIAVKNVMKAMSKTLNYFGDT